MNSLEVIQIEDDQEEDKELEEEEEEGENEGTDDEEDDVGDPINSIDINGRGITTKTSKDMKKMTLISSGDQAEMHQTCVENIERVVEKSKVEQLVDFEASEINNTNNNDAFSQFDYRKDFRETYNIQIEKAEASPDPSFKHPISNPKVKKLRKTVQQNRKKQKQQQPPQ